MNTAILADISTWIDYLRGRTQVLADYLLDDTVSVVMHDMVLGELVLGGLKKDNEAYQRITLLRKLPVVTREELLTLIERRNLAGKGIGFVDVNLVASCLIADAKLLTLDTKLQTIANECGISFS